jgi:hypothetical protein
VEKLLLEEAIGVGRSQERKYKYFGENDIKNTLAYYGTESTVAKNV